MWIGHLVVKIIDYGGVGKRVLIIGSDLTAANYVARVVLALHVMTFL
jgi:hypothetical protein